MHRRSRAVFAMVSGLALALAATIPAAAGGSTATYEVTITNLETGQPFTPPAVAIHRGSAGVFHVGAPASFGVKEIAENGNLTPLVDALDANRHVTAVWTGSAPLVGPGSPGEAHGFTDSVTFTIETTADGRFLSWVSMLICTNDGFTGVNRLKLPNQVGHSVWAATAGYDAGTEVNTESFGDMVPPCQLLSGLSPMGGTGTSDPALAEGGVIHHHGGIVGDADLSAGFHGWDDPVGTILVTRIG